MKSPTSSVGRIDDDGILNGSARNDRSRNTINKTGKNAFEYSTHDGSRKAAVSTCSRCATAAVDSLAGTAARWRSKFAIAARARSRRRPSSTSLSTSQATPVTAVRRNRIRAKFIGNGNVVRVGWSRTGCCKRADCRTRGGSLLARLLLLEQLLLPRHVAAVAFCQHVLAKRLDSFTRDDLRADRRLDRYVEHLPRNQRAHFRCDFASPIDGHRAMHHHRE